MPCRHTLELENINSTNFHSMALSLGLCPRGFHFCSFTSGLRQRHAKAQNAKNYRNTNLNLRQDLADPPMQKANGFIKLSSRIQGSLGYIASILPAGHVSIQFVVLSHKGHVSNVLKSRESKLLSHAYTQNQNLNSTHINR